MLYLEWSRPDTCMCMCVLYDLLTFCCTETFRFFSQVNISYKAPSTTSDPQTPSAIGYAVILEVDIQRSGVTVIPNLGLTISLPVGSSSGNVWYNYYYLYPASAVMSVMCIHVM